MEMSAKKTKLMTNNTNSISANLIRFIKTLQQQHRRLVPNNSWSPTGVATLTNPLQHISGRIMTDALEDHEGTVSIGGRTITNLRFADDIDGLAGEEEEVANLVE